MGQEKKQIQLEPDSIWQAFEWRKNIDSLWLARPVYDEIHYFSEGMAGVKKDGKWGFLDENGCVQIEPQYEGVEYFWGGNAAVQCHGKWGLIDKAGKWALDPLYEKIVRVSKKCSWVFAGSKWCVLRKNKSTLSQFFYDDIKISLLYTLEEVKENPIFAKVGDCWGLFDIEGSQILGPIYEEIEEYEMGRARVKFRGKWGVISQKGEWLLAPFFDSIGVYTDKYVVVLKDKEWEIWDWNNNFIRCGYHYRDFKIIGNLCFMGIEDDNETEWRCVDLKTNTFWDSTYEGIAIGDYCDCDYEGFDDSPTEGYFCLVNVVEGFGVHFICFVGKDGKLISNRCFKKARPFSEGLACAYDGMSWGFINRKGSWVIEPTFDIVSNFSEGLAWAEKAGKSGYINRKGEWAIDGEAYEKIHPFKDGLANVRLEGKWGAIDRKGTWALPSVFDAPVEFYGEKIAIASVGGYYGLLDRSGTWLVKPVFESAWFGIVRGQNSSFYAQVGFDGKKGIIKYPLPKTEEDKRSELIQKQILSILKPYRKFKHFRLSTEMERWEIDCIRSAFGLEWDCPVLAFVGCLDEVDIAGVVATDSFICERGPLGDEVYDYQYWALNKLKHVREQTSQGYLSEDVQFGRRHFWCLLKEILEVFAESTGGKN